jgi:dolichyl-phosphate beta-glucosyltransferase
VPDGSLTLVVPLYNEAARFDSFAAALAAFVAGQPEGSELVFVDDGSADDTATLVEKLIASAPRCPVRLLRRPHLGKGAALQAALSTATTPVAGFCDLDLSTPLADFGRITDAARQAPVLAIGSRDLAASHITKQEGVVREFLGRAFNRAVQLMVAPGIVDTQCGAKVAQTELWREILPHCRERGFAWDVEVVAVANSLDIPVLEMAIEWRHDEGSQVRVLRDGMAMVQALPRIRRNVVRPKVHRPAEPGPCSWPPGPAGPDTGVFDERNAAVLAEADAAHWWFRSKAALVAWTLRRWEPEPGRLVDLGAGAGGVTAMLGWPHDHTLLVEGNAELARQARHRHGLIVVRAGLDHIPLATGSASVVCLLDVLEHLPHPGEALAEARRLLRARGQLIVNVPGHPRLWSAADEALGHVRRYSRVALRAELEHEGFEVVFMSHVFSWLVLPVWARRRLSSGATPLGLDIASPAIDAAALFLTRLERAIVTHASLPLGTSVLCVATAHGSARAEPPTRPPRRSRGRAGAARGTGGLRTR